MEVINALGRRKSAVARVYVNTGKGNITINDRPLEEYFREDTLRYIVQQPLELTGTLSSFDIKVTLTAVESKVRLKLSALQSPARFARSTKKLIALFSNQTASSPVTAARSRERNLVSPVLADASNSANVNIYYDLRLIAQVVYSKMIGPAFSYQSFDHLRKI